MKNSIKGTILLLLFILCATVSAKTYYVAPTGGSDLNPGTIDQPWATWKKAFNTAQAGDTVYFRGGSWYPNYDFIAPASNSGTHDNPICYLNYPGETPIYDCRNINVTYETSAILINSTYIKVKGLIVQNMWQNKPGQWINGIKWEASNNPKVATFENMTFRYISGAGFIGSGYDTLYLTNCDSYYNCDTTSTAVGHEGGRADGFNIGSGGVATDTSKIVYIDGCRAWHNSDDGIDLASTKQFEIHDTWIWYNGHLKGDGTGLKLSYSHLYTPEKRKVYNCIFAYHTMDCAIGETNLYDAKYGIYLDIYNTSSFKDNIGHWHVEGDFDADLVRCHANYSNNIVYKNTGQSLPGWPSQQAMFGAGKNDVEPPAWVHLTANTFIWWQYSYTQPNPAFTVSDDDFVSLDTAQLRWPRKPDGSLPDITFMKLKAGSDLIDKGSDLGLPYFGSAPDLGYSEYISGSVTAPSPVYLSSAINNSTPARLEMNYNLTLANIVPPVSAFTVTVNSSVRAVSSITVSGDNVLLTLASPVVYSDLVTVAYTKSATNPLQTSSGGQAVSISAQPVTNNCIATTNQSPVVYISSPTKSTSFISPATITIDAIASDPDGTISMVEFYHGTVKLGERTTMPYSYIWKEVNEGTYSLTAVATDNKNLRTTSAAVFVVVEKSATAVNQLPVVSITKPGTGRNYKKNDKVVINAEASDPDGTISKVELKNGVITLVELATAPYTYIWEIEDTGTYVITAIATDNLGGTTESSALELEVSDFNNTSSEILHLYPNPNNGHFLIDFYSSLPDEYNKLAVVSLAGKTVYNDIISSQQSWMEFDLSSISAGPYVIMITSGNTIVAAKKFIKQ